MSVALPLNAEVSTVAVTGSVQGRLKFGGGHTSAPFPSAVVVFRPPARSRVRHRPAEQLLLFPLHVT